MLLPDVNVLVYAHRPESPHHQEARTWIEAASEGRDAVGWLDVVLSGFLRICTNPRVFEEPTPMAEATSLCDELLGAPAAVRPRPGPDHWGIFTGLCRDLGLRGVDVPDAYLAALAIERGATLVTYDLGFARFGGLRWSTPTV